MDSHERECIQPQQKTCANTRKKCAKVLDAFTPLAFAIAPVHSTFIRQIDVVSCHPACLLRLCCALSRRVVNGILQVPYDRLWLPCEMVQVTLYYNRSKLVSTPGTPTMHWEVAWMYTKRNSANLNDTCFFCDGTPHIMCHECEVLHCTFHATILCQWEISIGLCQFKAANLAAAAATFVIVVAVGDATDNARPGVWICCMWYAMFPQYPQNADGPLRNHQEFCTKLQEELKTNSFGMCTMNPSEASKPSPTYTRANLIFKCVFCNYL